MTIYLHKKQRERKDKKKGEMMIELCHPEKKKKKKRKHNTLNIPDR